nr:hypothetical protein B0A51_12737 [Rachicladosporium sp. CCFEE 5018]
MNPSSPVGPGNQGKGKASQSPTTPAGSKGKGEAAEEPPTPQKGKRKPSSPPAGVGAQPQKRKKSDISNGSNAAGPSSARPVTPGKPTESTTTTSVGKRNAPIATTSAPTGPDPSSGPSAPPVFQSNQSRVRRPFGSSNTFRVLVGKRPNHLVFTLHEDLFCQRSRYFRGQRAWTNLELKGQPNQVSFNHVTELPDVDPEVFGRYVAASISAVLEFNEPIRGIYNLNFRSYFDLYILADYLGDLRMANSVIDSLMAASEISDDLPDWKADIDYLYSGTLPGSKLRALCEDWLLHETAADNDANPRTDINHELLVEVFQKYRVNKGAAMDAWLDDGLETRW